MKGSSNSAVLLCANIAACAFHDDMKLSVISNYEEVLVYTVDDKFLKKVRNFIGSVVYDHLSTNRRIRAVVPVFDRPGPLY